MCALARHSPPRSVEAGVVGSGPQAPRKMLATATAAGTDGSIFKCLPFWNDMAESVYYNSAPADKQPLTVPRGGQDFRVLIPAGER